MVSRTERARERERAKEKEGEAKDRLMTLGCLMWTVDVINTMISFLCEGAAQR